MNDVGSGCKFRNAITGILNQLEKFKPVMYIFIGLLNTWKLILKWAPTASTALMPL